ncbi:hypothetical protein D2V84_31630 [Burkholderia pseudomallei]|nr:hypothetical protein D2V84_31630 [Burkholderia pseudomallei]
MPPEYSPAHVEGAASRRLAAKEKSEARLAAVRRAIGVTLPPSRRAAEPPSRRAAEPPSRRTAEQPNSRTAEQPNSRTAEQPNSQSNDRLIGCSADGPIGANRRAYAPPCVASAASSRRVSSIASP